MKRQTVSYRFSNETLATMLTEIADRLAREGGEPFRVAAYRNAALSIRRTPTPLVDIYEQQGLWGLEQLPGIGRSLSRKLAQAMKHGRSRQLEQLRKRQASADPLVFVPSIGPELAMRIRRALGSDSLAAVLRAARDGRLRRVVGVGDKRVRAIRQALAAQPVDETTDAPASATIPCEIPVGEVLHVDQRYRDLARAGRLPRTRPRAFNPTGAAWLPVFQGTLLGRRWRAHYSNSAASQRAGCVRDWVLIACEDKASFGRWTVLTARHGPLAGRRVVRGRERECQEYYARHALVQRSLIAPSRETEPEAADAE